jgi:hypothetical protein
LEELINQIVARTGVTAQQAKDGVATTVSWVKDAMPSDMKDRFGQLIDDAGALTTGAVDKAKEAGGAAASAAGGAAATGQEAAGGAWDKTKKTVTDLMPGNE